MSGKCKALDVFNTSLGTVAILGFYDEAIPFVGMIIMENPEVRWRVTGVGLNKIFTIQNSGYDLSEIKGVYDCTVTPIEHTDQLRSDKSLYIHS